MRRIDIINCYNTLGKVKLNKVDDKALRRVLLDDHFKMYRVERERADFVSNLNARFEPGAMKEANEAYQEYLEAESEKDIELVQIDREVFVDAIVKGNMEFTLAEMAFLEPLFKK